MPLKVATTIIPGMLSSQRDTSMGEALVDLQVVTMGQLKSVIKQMEGNTAALNKKLNKVGIAKVKLPAVK